MKLFSAHELSNTSVITLHIVTEPAACGYKSKHAADSVIRVHEEIGTGRCIGAMAKPNHVRVALNADSANMLKSG